MSGGVPVDDVSAQVDDLERRAQSRRDLAAYAHAARLPR
jgi:hypothetical protein